MKLDLRKEFKHLYNPSAKKIEVVDVPAFQFLTIDGEIEPGQAPATSPSFQEAVGALYGASYALKFMSKLRKENPIDYTVMPLEGLWWVDSGEFDITKSNEPWKWTLLIMQPAHITSETLDEALTKVRAKEDNPALEKLHLERFHEGLSVQIMHVGAYSEEPATIEKMMILAQENGYVHNGKHHEIYLGDPRRAKAENLKTVLRQPVKINE